MPITTWQELNKIIHNVRGYLTVICRAELLLRKIKTRKLDGETMEDLEKIHNDLLDAKVNFKAELEKVEDIISRQPERVENGFKEDSDEG